MVISYRAVNTPCLGYKKRSVHFYREIIAVCYDKNTKQINTLCELDGGKNLVVGKLQLELNRLNKHTKVYSNHPIYDDSS
jgi:hypothetical protein